MAIGCFRNVPWMGESGPFLQDVPSAWHVRLHVQRHHWNVY